MADFISAGWGAFVSFSTIVSVLACVYLAWHVSRQKLPNAESGSVETTGHVWDEDLQELNNPLPRWWLYLFYITCLFGALYLLLYPGLGTFKGVFSWTSTGQYEQEVASANARYQPLFAQFLEQPVEVVANNSQAVEMGERLFLTYCSQCHGSDGRGSRSFPNLADNDWLGTGDANYIKNTVLNGRNGVMPAMLAAIGGTDEAARTVANYVLSLSSAEHDAELAKAGQTRFLVCGGCHGMSGEGNPALGAPALNDSVWLYEGTESAVMSAVQNGLNNKMPAFGELLGEGKAHVVAAYVLSLSKSGSTVQARP